MTQNLSDMWLSTFVTGAAQLRYVTKIGPPQPFWCVKRRPIRYDLLKLSAIGESLLTSLFTFFLISIRLNSQKPWSYIGTKCKSWKSWLSFEQFVQFSALCKKYWLKYQPSKTAKLLCGKKVNELYILRKISSFSKRISPKPFGVLDSNFQR